MNHLTHFAAWVEANRGILEQHGHVSFSYGPPGTDNPSAHLLVAFSQDADAELVLWESGDVEFNHGSFADSVFEHHELDSVDELAALLTRFLNTVTTSP